MARTIWLMPFLLLGCLFLETGGLAQETFFRPQIQAKDIEPTLRTDWYGLYLQGKKIGYFKTTRAQEGTNIVDSFAMTMKLVSFGQKAEMNITQAMVFEGQAPFRLLRGSFVQADGNNTSKVSASRTDKGFEHVIEVAGQKRARQVADLDYILPDAMGSETWLRTGPKVGAQILSKDLDLQEWKMDQSRSKVLAIKNSLVGGVEVKFYEVESETKKDKLTFLSRHDADGKLLSGNFAIFELRRETEEQAKNAQFSQDLFVLGMAKVDRPIGRTTNLAELVLEVGGKAGEVFDKGPRQSIEAGKDNTKLIKTGKVHGQETKATAKEIEEGLEETSTHAITNPKVKALAEKAVEGAQTPEEKVRRIVAFAHEYVKPSLSATLPNIHDLLEKKQGDCKSYALLVTNLCRASGIPAREVSGLLYMGDDSKAFGGHAWNEVVLNGVWVPVDASLNQVEVDAGHLCFGSEHRATKNLLNSLGQLSFKVVEVKTSK